MIRSLAEIVPIRHVESGTTIRVDGEGLEALCADEETLRTVMREVMLFVRAGCPGLDWRSLTPWERGMIDQAARTLREESHSHLAYLVAVAVRAAKPEDVLPDTDEFRWHKLLGRVLDA